MAEDILLQDFFDDEVFEMIEKQSEYLQKLPIEPTVANPVYTNGQTEETKHVEEDGVFGRCRVGNVCGPPPTISLRVPYVFLKSYFKSVQLKCVNRNPHLSGCELQLLQ